MLALSWSSSITLAFNIQHQLVKRSQCNRIPCKMISHQFVFIKVNSLWPLDVLLVKCLWLIDSDIIDWFRRLQKLKLILAFPVACIHMHMNRRKLHRLVWPHLFYVALYWSRNLLVNAWSDNKYMPEVQCKLLWIEMSAKYVNIDDNK